MEHDVRLPRHGTDIDVTNYEGGAGGGGVGVMVSAGAGLKEGLISADIDVYEMASMWLS